MFKKIILIIGILVLNVSILQAVILKNGTKVPYEIAVKTWLSIQKLKNECKWDFLADLLKSAESKDHNLQFIIWSDEYSQLMQKKSLKQKYLEQAKLLGLTNSENIIDRDVAEVIKSSISVSYKGIMPIIIHVQSPFAWSNWLNLNYWQRKD